MVRMPAFGLDGPWRDRTGFAQTMECVTGMAWLTGFPDGPPVLLRGACDPTSGLHATIGALIALRQRDDDGQGRLVEATMVEAALNVAAEQVVERSAGGPLRTRDGNRGPDAVPQGVYPCAGEDTWVAVAASTEAEWTALAATVDPAWLADPDLADPDARRKHHDRLDTGIAAWTRIRASDEAAETLGLAGVPAAVVVAARDIAFNPQLRHRRLFEVEEHPVTGSHELPAFPVRLSRVDSWHPRSSPALGQHNDEVLTELGLGLDEIQALRELGVIGERVAGL
jgi:crotonobetainyl-CoA:carnitine CoA-transferase CaiB-like acyl-CoA transferase